MYFYLLVGSRYYYVRSSTDPEIMFHLASQSATFPLTKGVPAVRARKIGLNTFNWSYTYLAWSRFLVEKVH
jgi:hypothetical protein